MKNKIVFLLVCIIASSLEAQTTDVMAVNDVLAKFPPTLTAKEAQAKWENFYKSKCIAEREDRLKCQNIEKGSPYLEEVALYLNLKHRNIEMITLTLANGPLARMNANELIKQLPLEKEKTSFEKINEVPGKYQERTGYRARTLLGSYYLTQEGNRISSISRISSDDGLGYAPKYEIKCDKNEFEGRSKDFQVASECHGDVINLNIRFKDKNAIKAVDFNFQYSKINYAIGQLAPSTKHPEIWSKIVSVFKEMSNEGKTKPTWFNKTPTQYQAFPLGSFYIKTDQEGEQHLIELSWSKPMMEGSD